MSDHDTRPFFDAWIHNLTVLKHPRLSPTDRFRLARLTSSSSVTKHVWYPLYRFTMRTYAPIEHGMEAYFIAPAQNFFGIARDASDHFMSFDAYEAQRNVRMSVDPTLKIIRPSQRHYQDALVNVGYGTTFNHGVETVHAKSLHGAKEELVRHGFDDTLLSVENDEAALTMLPEFIVRNIVS